MPDERNETPTQSGTAGHGNGGSGRLVRAAARARQVANTLQGEEVFAEVHFSEEHISAAIALQGQVLENEDRQSQRDHDAGKESRRFAVLIVVVAILAVVGIIVFLTIYKEAGLLGYILSGVGGLIAGAFGGYGYANRPR